MCNRPEKISIFEINFPSSALGIDTFQKQTKNEKQLQEDGRRLWENQFAEKREQCSEWKSVPLHRTLVTGWWSVSPHFKMEN